MKCYLCPRKCGVDRDNGQIGYCGVTNKIYIARAALHMWEEPCISGSEGSGAVFFVGCSMGCVFCQNYLISRGKGGKEYSLDELAKCFINLQEQGANNINLVTPTHYSNQIADAVYLARKHGLNIPIVYNCSGYEDVETLKKLEDVIDIYLTDFKYMDSSISAKYSNVPRYPEVAKDALCEMVRQKPEPVFDEKGMMKRGVIVRNLLLPGNVNNSKAIVKYVYETYRDKVYISLMNQYTPLEYVKEIKELSRKVTKREYARLLEFVFELGAKNVYIQEGDVADESFIPEFE